MPRSTVARRMPSCGTLKDRMDREAELFVDLGRDVERLRDTFQQKGWGPSLSIAQGIERSAWPSRRRTCARDEDFVLLRKALDLPRETAFSAAAARVARTLQREGLEESWRRLRMSVVRLKTATGRMRYSAEAMADTLNRILERCSRIGRARSIPASGTPTGRQRRAPRRPHAVGGRSEIDLCSHRARQAGARRHHRGPADHRPQRVQRLRGGLQPPARGHERHPPAVRARSSTARRRPARSARAWTSPGSSASRTCSWKAASSPSRTSRATGTPGTSTS